MALVPNPQKPHEWGLTVWSVADSISGYVYNWNIYGGKRKTFDLRTTNNDGRGAVHWVTWDICDEADLLEKGHHVYCDNYFSLPTLFQDLAQYSTGACGTLRQNRVGVVERIKRAKPIKNDDAVTDYKDECNYFSWMDRNQVNLITTIHTQDTFVKRTRIELIQATRTV